MDLLIRLRERVTTRLRRAIFSPTPTLSKATAHSKLSATHNSIFLSRYFALVLVVAVLLNRVQHIVVPPRPLNHRQGPRDDDPNPAIVPAWKLKARAMVDAMRRLVLPLDLSSTSTRLLISTPTLYIAFKSLAILALSILQVRGVMPSPAASAESRIVRTLGVWSIGFDMSQICWNAFLSAGCIMVVNALIAGLDGRPGDIPHFNLFSYASIVHTFGQQDVYRHPLRSENGVARPDVHILLNIALPLFQATVLHVLSVRKDWAKKRLIPTTIISIVNLAHFAYTLYKDPAAYLLPSFITNIIETSFVILVILTHFLDYLTRFLLTAPPPPSSTRSRNRASGPFLAPSTWSSSFGHDISSEDEFSAAIVKLGIASLEATNFVGLANEVAPLAVRPSSQSTLAATRRRRQQRGGFYFSDDEEEGENTVRIGPSSAALIDHNATELRRRRGGGNALSSRRVAGGFHREITRVRPIDDASTGNTPTVHGAWGPVFFASPTRVQRRFVGLVGRWCIGFYVWVRRKVWRAPKEPGLWVMSVDGTSRWVTRSMVLAEQMARAADDRAHDAFAQDGEDEEDDDYVPPEDVPSDDDASSVSSEASAHDDFDDTVPDRHLSPFFRSPSPPPVPDDALALYADLSAADAPLLLAHLQEHGPLTRQRYGPIIPLSPPQRGTQSNDDDDDEDVHQKKCVICYSNARSIVCWPCRCLAICDDCRGSLAARTSSSKHACPCCRQSVDGYSRIYFP